MLFSILASQVTSKETYDNKTKEYTSRHSHSFIQIEELNLENKENYGFIRA